ncbi:MAG: hypothetical protein J1F20_03125 [Muribaculaceae bacterium]|nr:hypothetical protein [Muribaculaceae bacterium]
MSDASLRKLNNKINAFTDNSNTRLTDADKKALCSSLQDLSHAVIMENADVSGLSRSSLKKGLENIDTFINRKVNDSKTLNELISGLNK